MPFEAAGAANPARCRAQGTDDGPERGARCAGGGWNVFDELGRLRAVGVRFQSPNAAARVAPDYFGRFPRDAVSSFLLVSPCGRGTVDGRELIRVSMPPSGPRGARR